MWKMFSKNLQRQIDFRMGKKSRVLGTGIGHVIQQADG
jgi:hypothetical protein